MTRSSSVFHMSLNRPRLVAGVGSEAFGLIVVMGVMAMSLPIALSIPPMFLFLRWVYRKDAVLLKAFLGYLKQADLYDPWVRAPVAAQRPPGFGRGLFC
jgi:type IV secretory pathway VirB3-like protein